MYNIHYKEKNKRRKEHMAIKRIINIEDDAIKHCNINKALEYNGYPSADWKKNAEDGIECIEAALRDGKPYELLIEDMHFKVNGVDDFKAGLYVIEQLKKKNIDIPIIVCSSIRYTIPEIEGCIFYNSSRDLNWDFREVLAKLN